MTWGFSCLKSLRFWSRFRYIWAIGAFWQVCFVCLVGLLGEDQLGCFEIKVWCAVNAFSFSIERANKTYRLKIHLPFAFEANLGQSTGQSPSSISKGIPVGGEHNLRDGFGVRSVEMHAVACGSTPGLWKHSHSRQTDSFCQEHNCTKARLFSVFEIVELSWAVVC